jgi:hypothetical protein
MSEDKKTLEVVAKKFEEYSISLFERAEQAIFYYNLVCNSLTDYFQTSQEIFESNRDLLTIKSKLDSTKNIDDQANLEMIYICLEYLYVVEGQIKKEDNGDFVKDRFKKQNEDFEGRNNDNIIPFLKRTRQTAIAA